MILAVLLPLSCIAVSKQECQSNSCEHQLSGRDSSSKNSLQESSNKSKQSDNQGLVTASSNCNCTDAFEYRLNTGSQVHNQSISCNTFQNDTSHSGFSASGIKATRAAALETINQAVKRELERLNNVSSAKKILSMILLTLVFSGIVFLFGLMLFFDISNLFACSNRPNRNGGEDRLILEIRRLTLMLTRTINDHLLLLKERPFLVLLT